MHRHVSLLVVVALLVCGVAAAASPDKPVWPTNFVSPFGLYVAFPSVVNGSADFYYKYDSLAQAQLIDYQQHCIPLVHWDAVGHPCQLFFQPSGIYVHQPATGLECCQLVADVGAVPPEFLKPFTFDSVQQNITDMYGDSHTTNYWTGPDDFAYWTDATTGFDVRFKDGPTGITWRWGNFDVKEQSVDTFKLPNPNCSKKCGFLGKAQEMSASEMLPLFADP
eukprot:EC692931.1.p2 GENE.EC692931.1~~EC692931.1.p2  ORF type:complete len:222 (+),score=87.66 EC692931.1:99-764(+)